MDPIKAYLKDVRPIPLLTAQEEIDLSRRVQKGDKEARDKMIRSNLRLVISIAKRYVNLGVPLSDLIEEGNLGANIHSSINGTVEEINKEFIVIA